MEKKSKRFDEEKWDAEPDVTNAELSEMTEEDNLPVSDEMNGGRFEAGEKSRPLSHEEQNHWP